MNRHEKNSIYQKLKRPIFIATLGFILVYIYRQKDLIYQINWQITPQLLFASFLLACSAIFFATYKLKLILNYTNINSHLPTVLKSLIHTNLLRYIPGGIWNHLGLAASIKENSQETSLKSVATALSLDIIFLLYTSQIFLLLFYPPLLIALIIVIETFSLKFIAKKIQQKVDNRHIKEISAAFLKCVSIKEFAVLVGLNLCFWICTGLSFATFTLGTTSNIDTNPIYLSGAYIVAWSAGFLFLPAPSGLGAREFVLGRLLASKTDYAAIGFSLSLLFRILILARDLLLFTLLIVWANTQKMKKRIGQNSQRK